MEVFAQTERCNLIIEAVPFTYCVACGCRAALGADCVQVEQHRSSPEAVAY